MAGVLRFRELDNLTDSCLDSDGLKKSLPIIIFIYIGRGVVVIQKGGDSALLPPHKAELPQQYHV